MTDEDWLKLRSLAETMIRAQLLDRTRFNYDISEALDEERLRAERRLAERAYEEALWAKLTAGDDRYDSNELD